MDIWLVVSVCLCAVLILWICTMLVIYFSHDDDKNAALFPKMVTIFGLWLAFASVLILPYDVANSRGDGGGVRVDLLWYIAYITLAVLVVIVVPYAFFFYESDTDPNESTGFCDSQGGSALKYTILFFIVFVIVLVIFYALLHNAEIPVVAYTQFSHQDLVVPIGSSDPANAAFPGCDPRRWCFESKFTWKIAVTFPVYIMAFLSFIGWFFFCVFVGVGLIALPMDLINDFRTRPVPMTSRDYYEEKTRLAERADKLLRIAHGLQGNFTSGDGRSRAQKRKDNKAFLGIEKHYIFLKKDIELLEIAYKLKGGNPLVYITKLVLGIIGLGVSCLWVIHIIIFMLPKKPYHPFLNTFFIELEEAFGKDNFGLLGVLAFALFALYLLGAAVKGNFKLGVRFLFWKIYPMELGKTFMNSFLFNTEIILLISVPTVQFCAFAFPEYVRYTSVDMLFGTQIKYMQFFKYFFANNVFIFIMVILFFLSAIWLLACPNDQSKKVNEEIDRLARGEEF